MTARMIFLSLPVRDLPRARAFYEELGFRINEHSSDERTASVVVDENIVVTLQTPDRFAELVGAEAGDPSRPTSLPCLTVEDRGEVDALVARAVAAGGGSWAPSRGEGARYTGSFTDPHGNAWQVLWLDQLHVVDRPGRRLSGRRGTAGAGAAAARSRRAQRAPGQPRRSSTSRSRR